MRERLVQEVKRLAEEKSVIGMAAETGLDRDTIYRVMRGERSPINRTLECLLVYPTIRQIIAEEAAQ